MLATSGAQQHDAIPLECTLDGMVIERSSGKEASQQNLCGDKAYIVDPVEKSIRERNYVPNIQQSGEGIVSKKRNPRNRALRYVVERTHSLLNRYRKLSVCFEKAVVCYQFLKDTDNRTNLNTFANADTEVAEVSEPRVNIVCRATCYGLEDWFELVLRFPNWASPWQLRSPSFRSRL